MDFSADFYLNYYVQSKTKATYWAAFAVVFLFVAVSLGFYLNGSNHAFFILNSLICALVCGALIFSVTVSEGRKLNRIIKTVEIHGDRLIFMTYSYAFLFFKLDNQQFEISKDALNAKEIAFPFNTGSLDHSKTFELSYNGGVFFVVYDCFPVELKIQLQS